MTTPSPIPAAGSAEPVPDAALPVSESGTGEGDDYRSRLLKCTAAELIKEIRVAKQIWVQFVIAPPYELCGFKITKKEALRGLERVPPDTPVRAFINSRYKSLTIAEASRSTFY